MVNDTSPDDTDDAISAAGRIEAALERIARRIEHPRFEQSSAPAPQTAELAARLDGLIGRVRSALGRTVE